MTPTPPAAGAAPPAGPVPGFSERIGRAILYPRQASAALCRGEPGGLRDAALLFLPRLLAGDVRRLGLQLIQVRDGGVGAALQLVVDAASALLPDVIGILLGGVVMSLLLGERERRLRPGLTIDLAAEAWLGWLFVHVLAALLQTILQRAPGPVLNGVVQWLALAVWVFYMMIGFFTVRRSLDAPAAAPPGGGA
jgi:hypothetical protein